AGLAVGTGFRGARALSLRQAVGDQAGDRGAAGVVCTEDLAQEDPKRNPWGEDPVQPAGDGGQRLRDDLLGEDVGERQVAVLKELPSQGADLFAERGGVARAHARDLLAGDGEWSASIFTSEARFAYPLSPFQ